MANRKYLLIYPGGHRRHIDRETRDSLLLSKTAKQTTPDTYVYTGKVRTYRSFAELRGLVLRESYQIRRFLAGRYIFEHKGKRRPELLETPEAMVLRLGL